MAQAETIFFDAVGTLFGVRQSVGEIYGHFAQKAGFTVDTQRLNQAFIQNFRQAPRAAFPNASAQDLPQLEYDWWRAIAQASFAAVDVQVPAFDAFFQPMFTYFATAEPWLVYPEVPTLLANLKASGYRLGIISNFDGRLTAVLEALDLAHWFDTVTISTQVGAAKPESEIFATALAQQDCPPEKAWHVGDSWTEDYEGAMAAGLRSVWLNREAALLPDSPPLNTLLPVREVTTLATLETVLNP
jgi:putative hydrolase of the HAD superfamily